MKFPVAFLLGELRRDLEVDDLAEVIAGLDTETFAPRVLYLTGSEAELPSALRDLLPRDVPLKGPLRQPFWNVGLIRRFLLAMGDAKPAVMVFAGREESVRLAGRVAGWVGRPAIYLAPSGDPAFPWGRRKDLDAFARIVASTGRLTLRLVDEFGVPEPSLATIYPAVDGERFAYSPWPGAREGESQGMEFEAGEPLVGVVGAVPAAVLARIQAALDALPAEDAGGARGPRGRIRLAAPGAASPLVDAGGSWTPEALARVSVLLFLPESDWDLGFRDLLRGMSAGRPALACVSNAYLDELIVEGENGRVAENAREPEEVARALAGLFAEPEHLGSMGIAARMWISGKFDPERRRKDFDGLLRVTAGIPFPPPKPKGPAADGIPIRFDRIGRDRSNL